MTILRVSPDTDALYTDIPFTCDTVAELATVSDAADGSFAMSADFGLYKRNSSLAAPFDGFLTVQAADGGGWQLTAISVDAHLTLLEEIEEELAQASTLQICEVYNTAGQSIGSGTMAKTTFNAYYPSPDQDTLNEFDLPNSRHIVMRTGWYEYTWAFMANTGGTATLTFSLYRNGVAYRTQRELADSTPAAPFDQSVTFKVCLTAGDIIEFYAGGSAGVPSLLGGETGCSLVIQFLGD